MNAFQRFNREALGRGQIAYAAMRGRSIASRLRILGGTVESTTDGARFSRLRYEAPPAFRIPGGTNGVRVENCRVDGTTGFTLPLPSFRGRA